jgi:hypothetical protein
MIPGSVVDPELERLVGSVQTSSDDWAKTLKTNIRLIITTKKEGILCLIGIKNL